MQIIANNDYSYQIPNASVEEQWEDASGILILFIARARHQLPIRVEF